MITQDRASSQVSTPRVWDKETARAEIGDTFRIPFVPIFQVVEKEILKDGRVWLKVKLNSCSYSEEWILEPEPAEQPQQAQVDKTAAQPTGFALDSISCQLRPNWEAIKEFKSGRAHEIHDVRAKLEPICTDTSCPYSTGYLEGYNSFFVPPPQPKAPSPPQWAATYNSEWDWYIVWVNELPVGRADTYEEAEQKAQSYIAGNKFWQEHRERVLAAYAG